MLHAVGVSAQAAAAGQPPISSPSATAADHYDRGVEASRQQRFDVAAREFEAAYELSRSYEVLYNIGAVNASLGRSVRSVDAFRLYLEQGAGKVPAERERAVLAEIERQEVLIGAVILAVTPSDAEIRVDGKPVERSAPDAPIRLDSGSHALMVMRSGYDPASRDVVVEGKSQQRLEIRLEPVAAAAAAPVALPPQAASRPEAGAPAQPTSAPLVYEADARHTAPETSDVSRLLWPESTQGRLGVAMGGAGVLGLAVGAVYALRMQSDLSDRDDANRCSATISCTNADEARVNALTDRASNKATVANTGFIAGGALLVGGAVLYLTAPPTAAESGTPAAALGSWFDADSAGFLARGTW